jgi:hypothetical protein
MVLVFLCMFVFLVCCHCLRPFGQDQHDSSWYLMNILVYIMGIHGYAFGRSWDIKSQRYFLQTCRNQQRQLNSCPDCSWGYRFRTPSICFSIRLRMCQKWFLPRVLFQWFSVCSCITIHNMGVPHFCPISSKDGLLFPNALSISAVESVWFSAWKIYGQWSWLRIGKTLHPRNRG